jgi:hypothetical protein
MLIWRWVACCWVFATYRVSVSLIYGSELYLSKSHAGVHWKWLNPPGELCRWSPACEPRPMWTATFSKNSGKQDAQLIFRCMLYLRFVMIVQIRPNTQDIALKNVELTLLSWYWILTLRMVNHGNWEEKLCRVYRLCQNAWAHFCITSQNNLVSLVPQCDSLMVDASEFSISVGWGTLKLRTDKVLSKCTRFPVLCQWGWGRPVTLFS